MIALGTMMMKTTAMMMMNVPQCFPFLFLLGWFDVIRCLLSYILYLISYILYLISYILYLNFMVLVDFVLA